jgi:hypothetical protein
MLYQLSYASALKPTKNSRQNWESASSDPKFSSTRGASTVEKAAPVPSPATCILLKKLGLWECWFRSLWKTAHSPASEQTALQISSI